MKLVGDNMTDVKRKNRSVILQNLHENGGTSRKRLSEAVQLTPATISKIIADMIEEDLVISGAQLLGGKNAGRREVMVMVNYRAYASLGLQINLGAAVLSATWLDGSLIFSEDVPLPPEAPADSTIEQLTGQLLKLADRHALKRERIIGIGVAIRGITDMQNRVARRTLGALDTEDYPIADKIEALSGMKVVLANNVRSLLMAQMFASKDKGKESQYFLRCEYGIGAALSVEGEIWAGHNNRCSEIGHVPVIRRGGKPCTCGKSGCLQTIASPTAIVTDAMEIFSEQATPVLWNMAKAIGKDQIGVEMILEAARNGDERVGEIVDRAIALLAGTLKTVIYTINPAKLVLYGQIFENSFYLNRFLAEMEEGMDAETGLIEIQKSLYNQQLETKAACILVIEHFFKRGGIME